jgi:hypothetical protein
VTGDTRQFNFSIRRIDSCGQRCRDVTADLANRGNRAEAVRVESSLYAGSTDGDRVWNGSRELDTVASNGTRAITTRIEIGYIAGLELCGASRTTMETTVHSANHEQTFITHPAVC